MKHPPRTDRRSAHTDKATWEMALIMSTFLEEPAAQIPSRPECAAEPFIDPHGEEPIRAELFGLEHLEAHARNLATVSELAPPPRIGTPLLRRFAENGRVLVKAHREIVEDFARGRHRSLEADWLTDNFHIIEDTLREVEHDLPGGYYSELPKLAAGPLAGYPRVFALALALVAHSDSGLDEARITRYVQAFQTIAPLTIGELWAVPTMLRLALIENLRRIADQVSRSWDEHRQADLWAFRYLPAGAGVADRGAEEGGSPSAPPVSLPRLTDAFVVRLIQVLRDQGPKAATVLSEIESRLTERHLDANEVLRREHRRQAAGQVSLGNCVTSLRLLSALDWNIFFERNSLVEAILRDDPGRVYARQEFATRDHYRRVVEKIGAGRTPTSWTWPGAQSSGRRPASRPAERRATSATTSSMRASSRSRRNSATIPSGVNDSTISPWGILEPPTSGRSSRCWWCS